MARVSRYICDVCGEEKPDGPDVYWADMPSKCSAHFPIDGANGGVWAWDEVCPTCRGRLHDAIRDTLSQIRGSDKA